MDSNKLWLQHTGSTGMSPYSYGYSTLVALVCLPILMATAHW